MRYHAIAGGDALNRFLLLGVAPLFVANASGARAEIRKAVPEMSPTEAQRGSSVWRVGRRELPDLGEVVGRCVGGGGVDDGGRIHWVKKVSVRREEEEEE